MSCSILIVNWNSWELLSNCLEALSKQTCRDFKVFVSDNASDLPPPDNIFKIIPDLTYVQNDTNLGFAKANNKLLEMVETDWVVLLNPDAFPEPYWLENLFKASQRYVDYAFFSSRLLQANSPELLDGDGDCYHISGLVWRNGHRTEKIRGINEPVEVFSPCAAAAMYSMEAINKVGGFDEDFFCYVEDVDLGYRMRLAGYRCLLVPDSVVHHVGSATTGSQHSDFAVYHGHRNLVWTFIKNTPGFLFWVLLPLHLLMNIVTVTWFSLRGQGRIVLRSKWDAVKKIPVFWRKRVKIQSSRVASVKDIWRVLNKQLISKTGHYSA